MVAGKVVVTLEHKGVAPKQFVPCPYERIETAVKKITAKKRICFFKIEGFYVRCKLKTYQNQIGLLK
jgi:hypothetical protein